MFQEGTTMKKATIMFPSPCGDVMFQDTQRNTGRFSAVSVPLRGCAISQFEVFEAARRAFPSPCGDVLFPSPLLMTSIISRFPSPCGDVMFR